LYLSRALPHAAPSRASCTQTHARSSACEDVFVDRPDYRTIYGHARRRRRPGTNMAFVDP